jgi:uncharacterized protein with PQ loop repeat
MIDTLAGIAGGVGACCFALCPLPQLIKAYRTKDVHSLSPGFLALWWSGEATMLFYAIVRTPTWQHLLNLGWSLFVTSLIIICYLRYRRV